MLANGDVLHMHSVLTQYTASVMFAESRTGIINKVELNSTTSLVNTARQADSLCWL